MNPLDPGKHIQAHAPRELWIRLCLRARAEGKSLSAILLDALEAHLTEPADAEA